MFRQRKHEGLDSVQAEEAWGLGQCSGRGSMRAWTVFRQRKHGGLASVQAEEA